MTPTDMINRLRRSSNIHSPDPRQPTQGQQFANGIQQEFPIAPHPGVAHLPADAPFSLPEDRPAKYAPEVEVVKPSRVDQSGLLGYVAGRLGADAWKVLVDEYRSLGSA